jgi:uncharacterized LabA/DUF88 family protein
MLQLAVFVDAGYLYAQGSALLAGQKQPRNAVSLNIASVLQHLRTAAKAAEPNARLLRIYWYDGLLRGGQLNNEQKDLALSPDVKMRLGLVNSRGEQKGVDSLIVTDLIDLARNQAISDALIVSGDEDIRVGVQVAQTFGVRVHLAGIKPARGSQSPDLIQEADTHSEWVDDEVRAWLTVQPQMVVAAAPVPAAAVPAPPARVRPAAPAAGSFDDIVRVEVAAAVARLDEASLAAAKLHITQNRRQVPRTLDAPTLAVIRESLARELTDDERKHYRKALVEAVLAA